MHAYLVMHFLLSAHDCNPSVPAYDIPPSQRSMFSTTTAEGFVDMIQSGNHLTIVHTTQLQL